MTCGGGATMFVHDVDEDGSKQPVMEIMVYGGGAHLQLQRC